MGRKTKSKPRKQSTKRKTSRPKKKGKRYYEVLGKAGGELFKLGFTGSKTDCTKYYVSQGWKAHQLVYREKHMSTRKPPQKL